MNIQTITATYCINYNGVYFKVNEEGDEDDCTPEQRKQFDACRTTIVDDLVDKCDEDGEYYGSTPTAIAKIQLAVLEQFPTVLVIVEFDDISS